MKDEFDGNHLRRVRIRANTFSYLTDDGSEDDNAKGTKRCTIKRKLKFENYKSA